MADFTLDKGKIDAFQKMMQSDPKALEKMMAQITPEQVSAAMGLLGSMDSKAKGNLGNLVSGLVPPAGDGPPKSKG